MFFYTDLMPVFKPLKSERLTVRLDSERLAKLEYWASENPLKAKSYNQIVQNALDEYLDRHTPSATEELITIKLSRQVKARLYNLYEYGYGSIDSIVESAIWGHARTVLEEDREYKLLKNEIQMLEDSQPYVRKGWESKRGMKE